MPPFCATAPTALILMYVKLKRWQTCNENTSKGWFFFLFFLFFFRRGPLMTLAPQWTRHLLVWGSLRWVERWEGLWRCADRVAVCGGMGSICISVWDPDSSGFSLHPDLLHACLTVYCPPTTSRSSLSTHLSFSAGTTRTYMPYTNTNARMHTQEPRVKVIISWL